MTAGVGAVAKRRPRPRPNDTADTTAPALAASEPAGRRLTASSRARDCRPRGPPCGGASTTVRRGPWVACSSDLRLVLAEDNLLAREGLRSMLAAAPGLERGRGVRRLRRAARRRRRAPARRRCSPTSGCRRPAPTRASARPRELRRTHPTIGVVVLSQYDDPEFALALLEDGSQGRAYLLKERMSDPRSWSPRSATVAARRLGGRPEGRRRAGARPQRPLAAGGASPRASATCSREMATGKDNAAIAASLVLTVRAVEKHINGIFSKLGLAEEPEVHKRVKAVLLLPGRRRRSAAELPPAGDSRETDMMCLPVSCTGKLQGHLVGGTIPRSRPGTSVTRWGCQHHHRHQYVHPRNSAADSRGSWCPQRTP